MQRFASEPVNANCVRDVAGAGTAKAAHRHGRRITMAAEWDAR
jgi:hypothetical protein